MLLKRLALRESCQRELTERGLEPTVLQPPLRHSLKLVPPPLKGRLWLVCVTNGQSKKQRNFFIFPPNLVGTDVLDCPFDVQLTKGSLRREL